ncbi:VWA domain-containing protein [Aneurinibacillus aneurinilyticus]|uniref:VWA domain-containing protein n=1 Tax=Aneurinibacillus aneurinilyticus TaxID=1391 RepID=UPI00352459E8
MSFLHPAALFLLLTVPFVWLLHHEKRRTVSVEVSHLKFWDEIVAQSKKKVQWRSPILLLRLLLAVLFVLAWAGPVPDPIDKAPEQVTVTRATYNYHTNTVIYQVVNHTEEEHKIQLSLTKGETATAQAVQLKPQAAQNVSFSVGKAGEGALRLSWQIDGEKWSTRPELDIMPGDTERKKILVLGGNTFVHEALHSLPYVEVTESPSWEQADKTILYDLYIIGDIGTKPDVPTGAKVWWLNYPAKGMPETDVKQAAIHVLVPLFFKHIDVGQMDWRGFQPMQVPENAVPFVEKANQPVVAALTEAPGKQVYMAMRWQETDLPLQLAFPVFVENVVSWFFDMEQPGQFVKQPSVSEYSAHYEQVVLWRTWMLVCIFGLLLLEWLLSVRYMHEKRTIIWKCIRVASLVGVLLAAVGMHVIWDTKRAATIFLIDRSLSMASSQKEVEMYIQSMLRQKAARDDVAVLSFGAEPMVDVPLQRKPVLNGFQTNPNPHFTNLEKAIDTALKIFPENAARRLVIVSDGGENAGQMLNVAEQMKQKRVQTLWWRTPQKGAPDVQLQRLTLPSFAYHAERLPLTADIVSNYEADGVFTLTEGDHLVLKQNIHVVPGSNTFVFSLPASERAAAHQYTGQIEFAGDTLTNDNVRSVSVTQKRTARVLLVGEEKDIGPLSSLMTGMDIQYTSVRPHMMPRTVEQLVPYDAIFLVNAPRYEFPPGAEQSLETVVRAQGTGLFVVGGERSFALGGYKDTLLEAMLPVQATMKDNKKHPATGLLLLIDASGSMEEKSDGIAKIEMAKEAAIRALEALESDDYVGVVAFSDAVEWLVPFGAVGNKEMAAKKIGQLRAGGGTVIIPALNDALQMLERTPIRIKHMVLLTDGQGELDGYGPYIEKMKQHGITLSTAAIGQDAAETMLNALARSTGGRTYSVQNVASLPTIFSYEAYTATGRYVNHGTFIPRIVQDAPYFPPRQFPPLAGYTGTGIKDNASLLLQSEKGDPILATWRYGLGNVAAWTSDLNGGWSAAWLSWPQFQQQWTALINWGLAHRDDGVIRMQAIQEDEQLQVDVSLASSNTTPHVMVMGPAGVFSLPLQAVGERLYRGTVELKEPGNYSLSATVQQQGTIVGQTKTLFTFTGSEYVSPDPNQERKLAAFMRIIGGRWVDEKENVFISPVLPIKAPNPLIDILLPFLLMLFYIDIALRKSSWKMWKQKRSENCA